MLQSSLPLPGGCRGGCPGFCGRLPVRCGRSRVAAMGGAYGFCEKFPVRCGRGLWLLWEGLTAAAGGFPGPSWCLWPPWCPWPLWQVLRSSAPVLPEYGDLGVMCQFLKTCFCSLLRQVLSFPWLFLVTHEVMGGLGSPPGQGSEGRPGCTWPPRDWGRPGWAPDVWLVPCGLKKVSDPL